MNSVTFKNKKEQLVGDVCENLFGLEGSDIGRPMIELMLICRAFGYSGYVLDLTIIPSPSYGRSLQMVESGSVDMFAGTVWSQELNDFDVYGSDDVIRSGELEKGIYTTEGHELLSLSPKDVDLKKYRGMTFKGWLHDWNIMNELTSKVVPVVHLPSMFKMLDVDRADFIFLEFPSHTNFDYFVDGKHYYPVFGVKICILDARKFIVSKKIGNAEFIYDVLNDGLEKMRVKGEIKKAYSAFGVMPEKVYGWRVLNSKKLK